MLCSLENNVMSYAAFKYMHRFKLAICMCSQYLPLAIHTLGRAGYRFQGQIQGHIPNKLAALTWSFVGLISVNISLILILWSHYWPIETCYLDINISHFVKSPMPNATLQSHKWSTLGFQIDTGQYYPWWMFFPSTALQQCV